MILELLAKIKNFLYFCYQLSEEFHKNIKKRGKKQNFPPFLKKIKMYNIKCCF